MRIRHPHPHACPFLCLIPHPNPPFQPAVLPHFSLAVSLPTLPRDQILNPLSSSLQRFLGGEIINAHQSLFWFGSHGPAFFTRAVRMIAVASMVILTIALETYYPRMLCIGVSDYGVCDQPTAGGIILLLISIIPPIISVMMLPQMIKKLVVITNVETMK